MKKVLLAAVMCAVSGLDAAAYFNGGFTGTTGPGGYKGTELDLVIGSGRLAIEPSLSAYTSDDASFNGKTFRTYAVRGVWEAKKYAVAGFIGATPEVNNYANKFAGGDITFSLVPGEGGRSRLAGPGLRGRGETRLYAGAGLKHTLHTQTIGTADKNTDQTEGSLFAGARILLVNLSASFTGYAYGAEKAVIQGFVPGLNFEQSARPDSSVNVKLDLPAQPLITPFVSYTGTKYKGGADSSAYLVGAYVNLSVVAANAAYQIFDRGSKKDSFLSFGAGIKF